MSALRHDQSDFNVLFIHSALDEAGLSVHAFRLYCHLARRAGRDGAAYPGAVSMAAVCRMKRDTVFAALRELEGRGMLARRKRHGSSNEYWLTKASQWRQVTPVPIEGTSPQTGLHPSPDSGLHPSPQTGRKGNPSKENPRKGNPEATPPASQGRVCDLAFEMLVKVQKGTLDGMTKSERGAINTALRAIREAAPSGTTPEQLAAEIKRRAAAYHEKFSEGTIITATALAKYWSQLGNWKKAGAAGHPLAVPPCKEWKALARAVCEREGVDDVSWLDVANWQDLTSDDKQTVVDEYKRQCAVPPIPAYDRFAREVIGWSPVEGTTWERYQENGCAREMLAKWATMTDAEKRPYMTVPEEPDFAWRKFANAKLGMEIVLPWSVLLTRMKQEIMDAWNGLPESERDAFTLGIEGQPVQSDPAFEALVEAQGSSIKGITESERGALNKALDGIRHAMPQDTTPDQLARQIKRRSANYRETMPPGTMLTASALAKHWSRCDSGKDDPTEDETASLKRVPLNVPPCPADWRELCKAIYDFTPESWATLPDTAHQAIQSESDRRRAASTA